MIFYTVGSVGYTREDYSAVRDTSQNNFYLKALYIFLAVGYTAEDYSVV